MMVERGENGGGGGQIEKGWNAFSFIFPFLIVLSHIGRRVLNQGSLAYAERI